MKSTNYLEIMSLSYLLSMASRRNHTNLSDSRQVRLFKLSCEVPIEALASSRDSVPTFSIIGAG